MEHVIFYPASDGSPAFRRVATLEDAVSLVEHLRNIEGVASVSVHALTEVPLSFRAYYRVEVPAAVPVAVESPVEAPPEIAEAHEFLMEDPAFVPEQPVAAGNGHGGAPTSLGFFA